jgi:hypothetical protein
MKKIIALIILLPLAFVYCKRTEIPAPDCINDLIRNNDHSIFMCENGARVDEYLFQGKLVYVFEPGNCGADMQAPVYDSNCNLIGALGGIIGNILINNVRFDKNAIFRRTIWKN